MECSQHMMESDERNKHHHYEGSMLHLLSNDHDNNSASSAFIVLPRVEYDQMKKEILNVRHSLTEFRSVVNFEIQQLKQESSELKQQVKKCKCEHRVDLVIPRRSSNMWNVENGLRYFHFIPIYTRPKKLMLCFR